MYTLTRFIPKIEFPSITNYKIDAIDEPLLSLSEEFLCQSKYYEHGVAGALKDCYARASVVERLKIAEKSLPSNYRFRIYDAYRPIAVQQKLWDYYKSVLLGKNPTLTAEELERETSFFVSKPSYDSKQPSLHNTGGAIDLTIIDDKNNELDMGTDFDDFSPSSWTNHFEPSYEKYEQNTLVRDNRRLLYNAMLNAGFTNLPSEWWHYDYGTKFWAYFNGCDALYEGIVKNPFKGAFPSI